MTTQKLQKILAIEGLASRRTIEQWIQAGRLSVNGQIVPLGTRVNTQDQIALDGCVLTLTQHKKSVDDTKLLLYYKRQDEICSTQDTQGRQTVFSHLPSIKPKRWIMVGRLDYNTLGLLLFTTDGLLSHHLLHPSYEIEREYAVRVHGLVTPVILKKLQQGIVLDGQLARFSKISTMSSAQGKNHWFQVMLKEGRKREVRRLWASQGITVSRLIRTRFGPIRLPTTLKPGQYIWLPNDTIAQLRRQVGL